MRKSQTTISTLALPVPGQRVHTANHGFQHSDGMTIAHITDEWGTKALVLMDDGTTEYCSGLRNEPGIGWHAGPSPSRLWIANRKKGQA